MNNKGRFSFVDALRGIASLSVVLFHANEGEHITELFGAMPSWLQFMLRHANLGVAIFFVLSGFVIAHSLRDQQMTLVGVGRFMLRRSIRLDPPYWLAIALTIGFSALATVVVKGRPSHEFSLSQIVAHIFYVQDILGFGNINSVFWTLCLEVQFYLVFALLLMASRTLFLLVFALSLLWPLGISLPIPSGLFLPLWFGFLLGVLAYWTWRKNSLILLFASYALIIGVAATLRSDAFALICVLTAIALLLVGLVGQMANLLSWKWLQFLGTISYSLYLVHNPITGATFRVGYMLTARTSTTEAVWWAISIAACIAAAATVYWLVERPSVAFARKINIAVRKPKAQAALDS